MPSLALFEDRPVEAIIGREPNWIVRSGISLIFVVVAVLLSITWFVRYPDNISSNITLTTIHPPEKLVAKSTGMITRLFVIDGESVSKEKPLFLLENSVNYEHLLELKSILNNLQGLYGVKNVIVPNALDIGGFGELQPLVNQLNFTLNEIKFFENSKQLPYRTKSIDLLSSQYLKLQNQLKSKLQTTKKKYELEATLLLKNKELKKQGLITESELVLIENSYLDKKLALEDITMEMELYEIKLNELAQQLTEFEILWNEKKQQLQMKLLNSYLSLKGKIDEWQHKYLVTAATSGIVSLNKYWSTNQHVKAGDIVMEIANLSDLRIGKISIKQNGVGKIAVGQKVYIELDSFPAIEYGKLEGKVKSISLIPGHQGYMVDVALPEKLITSFGKYLPLTANLTGSAKIITAEKRLLSRFLDKILYIFEG